MNEFDELNKLDLSYLVIAIELVLRYYGLPSALLELRFSNYYTNRFSVLISKLLVYPAIYQILEHYKYIVNLSNLLELF